MLMGFLVVCGVGTAVYVAIGFQAVLGCSHHVRGFHRSLHKNHNVVDLNAGHGAESIDVGSVAADLHADGVVYLQKIDNLHNRALLCYLELKRELPYD